ncbi:Lethal(3)malignant brain tumor-like protein 1, partial [Goodea atripinnis]
CERASCYRPEHLPYHGSLQAHQPLQNQQVQFPQQSPASLVVFMSTDMSSEGMYPSLFMSALSGQSDRTLSLCWEQHCKLLPGVQGIHASQVATWSVDEMIDGEALLLLTQTDIVKIMSIKLGPALKISNAILMFKTTDEGLK